MQAVETRIVILAALFVFAIASGFWLSRASRPFNPIIIALHKVIALLFAILTGMIIYQLQKPIGITPLIVIFSAIILLLVLALFISGALLSSEKNAILLVQNIHKTTSLLSFVFVSITLYLIILVNK